MEMKCSCWLSLNTGPNGECELCGRIPDPSRFISEEDMDLARKLVEEHSDPDWICWRWLCRKCRRIGVVSVNKHASARRMARKIEIHHRLKSPNCQGME